MPIEPEKGHSARRQTDESLRVERAKADDALTENVAAIEETADAVITRARARADTLLAAARAKTDEQSATSAASGIIEKERAREDAALRQERATADATLREERAEHARLSIERRETDKDLSTERARSDQAVATRDEFLGIVSHDLRNMLHSVVGFAKLIEAGAKSADHVEHVVMDARRIQRAAARMDRLIGDLVDVASIEAGRLAVTREEGDPSHVVAEAVESFQAQASAQGVSLVADVVSGLPLAAFDPARILQVLTNLLSNALKFTPAGGSVIVRVDCVADEARFAVHDTGVGIPGDKLDAVFERFRQIDTSDRRGVGLGLYISKSIVQGHGGRIWATSTMGEGSTFCFTLPLRKET